MSIFQCLFIWLYQVIVVACEIFLRSCGSFCCSSLILIMDYGLRCFVECGILVPRPGIEPVSPVLQSRFLTTGPPGKPHIFSYCFLTIFTVLVQLLSLVQLFAISSTVAHQAPLSSTLSQSFLKLMSIELVMLSNHVILCHPSSLLAFNLSQHTGFFPVSQLFASGGHSIGASASASVLPMNIQGLFLLRLNGWISLQSKGLSRVFSSTTLQKHQSFCTQISLWSNFHICTWLIEKPHLWIYAPLSAKVMSLLYYFV